MSVGCLTSYNLLPPGLHPLRAQHMPYIHIFLSPILVPGTVSSPPCFTGTAVSHFPPTSVYFCCTVPLPATLPRQIESRGLLSYQYAQQRKNIFLFFFFFSQSPTSMTIWRNYYYPHGQQWQHTTWQVSARGLSGASFSSQDFTTVI